METDGMEFLAGGGEMGARIRALDWSTAPLGELHSWAPELKALVSLMLSSAQPMFMAWGQEQIWLNNDPFTPILGSKHPSAVGQPSSVVWSDIWQDIGPLFDRVFAGEAVHMSDIQLTMHDRSGKPEEAHFSFSYNPVRSSGDRVIGLFGVCTETTERVMTERRQAAQIERQREVFEKAPGFIAVLRGPDHIFELANASYRQLLGNRGDLIGRSVRRAVPEAEGQGFIDLLDEVFRTGTEFIGRRVPFMLQMAPNQIPQKRFLDFFYQPITDKDGTTTGIFVEGTDVTDHVLAQEHLKLINLELKHRVKNTIAMVSAIAGQTLLNDAASAGPLRAFQDRLAVFGRAHDALTAETWATAEIHEVVQVTLEGVSVPGERITFEGPEMTLGSKPAVSLALAIHELASNAMKYGALSNGNGTVSLSWKQEGDNFVLDWQETDGPPVTPPTHRGFGSRLIERVLQADFGGDLAITYDPKGFSLEIRTNVSQIAGALQGALN